MQHTLQKTSHWMEWKGLTVTFIGVALIAANQHINAVVAAVKFAAANGVWVAFAGLALIGLHHLVDYLIDRIRSPKHSTGTS